MQIRSVINLFLKRLAPLLFALTLGANPVFAAEETAQVSLSEARNIAVYAIQNNQPELALQIGRGLLQANARDPFAHFIMASAYGQLGRPSAGRRSAARAYRFADASPDRLRSAQLAAQLAYAENRPTLAQVWLRRTAIHATSEQEEKLLARDYQALRSQNPWSFSLQTGLRPSSNVNNGADSASNLIDGRPDGGTLPPSSVALSGVIGSLDIATAYRLRANRTSATSIGARLYISRVELSDSAKAQAPGVSSAQFRSNYAEISLRHAFAVGDPEKRGAAIVDFALAESWYGGERNYQLARLSAERSWRLGTTDRLTLNALGEKRFNARYRSNNVQILGLGASYQRKLANGDGLTLSAALRDADAEITNGTFFAATVSGSYTLARPLGPARVSASVGLGHADYPRYITPRRPPTRRKDESVFADVTFFFQDYDYAGFAPTLRLRTGRKKSNFSVFTSREFSVSLGFQSKF